VSFLTPARQDQLDSIYRESHALWGSGLEFEDYRGLWQDLSATVWAGRHAGLYVWVDDRGEILSSVKLYRPELRLRERTSRVTVIGALFTPTAVRRRGHAAALVRHVLDRARAGGDRWVLLFSDIGTEYYAALGFRELPAEEDWGMLPAHPVAPTDGSLRPMTGGDARFVQQAHHDFCEGRPIAMLRDPDHWQFLDLRSTAFFERLNDRRLRQRRRVALMRGRFAGYLVAVEGRGEWNVREVGAPGGDPRAMAEVLCLGAEQARGAGLRTFYGWLPPGVREHLPGWGIRTRARRRAVPMVCPLVSPDDLRDLVTAEQAYLPFQDQF
jgi:predicted N-acetyltransferase YhbS